MRKIDLEELKSIQADILDRFKHVCEQHNLRYFLAAGTALGAVRHQGFIPWDDDIDVLMLRDDYEYLLSLDKLDIPPYYSLIHAKNVEHFGLPIALLVDERTYIEEPLLLPELVNRRRGVHIEIFPIDGLPENALMRKLHWLQCTFIRRMMYLCLFDKFVPSYKHGKIVNFIGSILTVIGKQFFGYQYFLKKLENLCRRYSYKKGAVVAETVWQAYPVDMPRKYIEGVDKVMFEGREHTTFAHCREYLTDIFGDYMQLPPVEKRIGHGMDAWWRD